MLTFYNKQIYHNVKITIIDRIGDLINMSFNKYKEIYEKVIIQNLKGIIFDYSPINDTYTFKPFSHNISPNSVEELGRIMRNNLPFYSYGEDEVIQYFNNKQFKTITDFSYYSYNQRLPKRYNTNDGLLSETLLDLLIQAYNPDAYKLYVRTLFRQDDANEIKGYDLTYFSKCNDEIVLWLGQSKLGKKQYCTSGIDKDIKTKYTKEYLSKQMYFVCDKPVEINDDAKAILNIINRINISSLHSDEATRINELIKCFKDNSIRINIPCLLAFEEKEIYSNNEKLFSKILNETEDIVKYYKSKKYIFSKFKPNIIFYVFPIENLKRLRDKETGFYAGLC